MTQMVVIGQWLILAVLVVIAVSAAAALGWLIGHKPDPDGPTRDFEDDSEGSATSGANAAREGSDGPTTPVAKKRRGRNAPSEPSFDPVTTPTATSQDDVAVPEGVGWSPPDLPEEYAATVINVAPINAGVQEARSAMTPVRPEDMPPAVRVERAPTAPSVVPPPRPRNAPVPPRPTSPHRVPTSGPSLSFASADPGYDAMANMMSPEPISATSINELTAIRDRFDPISAVPLETHGPDSGPDELGHEEWVSADLSNQELVIEELGTAALVTEELGTEELGTEQRETAEPAGVEVTTDEFDGLSLDELRNRLAHAQVQIGRIEAGAVSAWDRTVPALEDRIADLQRLNAQLQAKLNQLQQAKGSTSGTSDQHRKPADRRDQRVSSGVDGRS